MLRLTDNEKIIMEGHNSKGNQLKFKLGNKWVKLDSRGYEGLAETIVSNILYASNIDNFVPYKLIQAEYNNHIYNGCISENFIPDSCNLITAARLYMSYYGRSVSDICILKKNVKNDIEKFISVTAKITRIPEDQLGKYIGAILELDAFVLNDDRHFNNIAFLEYKGSYIPAPIFDNGNAFLSDEISYWSPNENYDQLISSVKAKPFSESFTEQLKAVKELFGENFKLLNRNFAKVLPNDIDMYDTATKDRVKYIVNEQYYNYNKACNKQSLDKCFKYTNFSKENIIKDFLQKSNIEYKESISKDYIILYTNQMGADLIHSIEKNNRTIVQSRQI